MKETTIEDIAEGYDLSGDFDFYNTRFATDIILPYCRDKSVLEVGCATGEMTRELATTCSDLTVIEPASRYCQNLRAQKLNVTVHNCLLQDYQGNEQYDIIVLASLLHHIEDPQGFLRSVGERLKASGSVLATVPNMRSLHRRVGVGARMIVDIFSTTERNIRFNQYGRYVKETLIELFRRSGFKVHECYGYMLKPFSSSQMMLLDLPMPVYQALFQLGKEYEELSSQLFIRASKEKSPKGI